MEEPNQFNGFCDKSDYSGDIRCNSQCKMCSLLNQEEVIHARACGKILRDIKIDLKLSIPSIPPTPWWLRKEIND